MRITKLDGLRGVFSLMVVMYHYPAEYIPEVIKTSFIVEKSDLFVDFFFVLSGFVITYNYHNHINTGRELWIFMKKRFIRLYPLLLYTTLICFSVFLGSKLFFPQYVKNPGGFGPIINDTINTLLFMNSTPVFSDRFGMNYPSWSISAEMIAYLFFGIVTLIAAKQRKGFFLGASIVLGMAFLSFKALGGMQGNYNFVRGIISFNIGYFVWAFSQKDRKFSDAWEIVLFVLFLGSLFVANALKEEVPNAIYEAIAIPLSFGTFIYVLVHTHGVISKLMDTKPFQFLGKISYSVYLNHSIILLLIPKAMFALLKLPENPVIETGVAALIIGGVVAYSNITYEIIEKRGGDILKGLMLQRRGTSAKVPAA